MNKRRNKLVFIFLLIFTGIQLISPMIQLCNCNEEDGDTHIHLISHGCHKEKHVHFDKREIHFSNSVNNLSDEFSSHGEFDLDNSFSVSILLKIQFEMRNEQKIVNYLSSNASEYFKNLKTKFNNGAIISHYSVQTKIINSSILII